MDYGELDVLLTFESCETRKCVNVSILDDGPGEPDEFFTYHLMRTSNLHPRIELDPVDGQVQIYDGDGESKYLFCIFSSSTCANSTCSEHYSWLQLHSLYNK